MQLLTLLGKVEGLPHVLHMTFLFVFAGIRTFLVICVGDFVDLFLLNKS